MPVNVSTSGAGAFVAVFLVALLIGVGLFARHHGYLRDRRAVMIVAGLIGVAVVYIMTVGLFYR